MIHDNQLSNTLDELSKSFSAWRCTGASRNYPKKLWEAAIRLTKTYPLKEVAQAIGIRPCHLKAKASKGLPTSQFVEVILDSPTEEPRVAARIIGGNGIQVEVKYQGAPQDLLPLVKHLFGGSSS